jgi:hypothetical protein
LVAADDATIAFCNDHVVVVVVHEMRKASRYASAASATTGFRVRPSSSSLSRSTMDVRSAQPAIRDVTVGDIRRP